MNFFQRIKLNQLRKKLQALHELREQQSNNVNVKNEVAQIYLLAKFYHQHRYDKKLPKAEVLLLECYRLAATLGEVKALYWCGEYLLEQGKFWQGMTQHPVFAASIHQKYAERFYEEAHAYLKEADARDYPFAKRLLGMAYIHGWGVNKDMDYGYKLVLDSIDQEKAWDRATKIFEQLKLNSPEFFTALRSYKK